MRLTAFMLSTLLLAGLFSQPAAAQHRCLGVVIIDSAAQLQAPDPIQCESAKSVKWVVINQSDRNLLVRFFKFQTTETGAPPQPSVDSEKTVKVDGNGAGDDTIGMTKKFKLKDSAAFPRKTVKYKYWVTAQDTDQNNQIVSTLDPDLEVTPPSGVDRGRGGRGGGRR